MRRLDEYLRSLGSAVRRGEVDVEALIKGIVEEIVRALGDNPLPRSSPPSRDEEASSCREVLEKLSSIEERLKKLEEAVAALGGQRGGSGREKLPAWLARLLEEVEPAGFTMLGDRRADLAARVLSERERLESHGLTLIELPRALVVIKKTALDDFAKRIAGISTSDDAEAREKLGHPYSTLFAALREAGMIFYDAKQRGWRLAL